MDWLALAAPLRAEILGLERLEDHARDVASAHGNPSRDVPAQNLLESFRHAKHDIERAYVALAGETQRNRDATPAEQWILDNAHVIDDQLREIEEDLPRGYLLELPRLARGPAAGWPRVYALALDFIAHIDGHIDFDNLVRYVGAYQTKDALTIGELWAVPIMLRIGLLHNVRGLALQELAVGRDRERADVWAERLLARAERRRADAVVAVAELAVSDEQLPPAFIVQLLKRLRDHDVLNAAASNWLAERCAEMGTTPVEITRREHLRQAENQVSIGNAITSMRVIAALDWSDFFEKCSIVERTLSEDPVGAYAATDSPSRDRYRHAVEDIAKRSDVDETGVARAAIALAQASGEAPDDAREAHVGHWLIGDGRRRLEAEVRYRPRLSEVLIRAIVAVRTTLYLGAIATLGAALTAGVLTIASRTAQIGYLALALLGLPFGLLSVEVAVTIVNWLVTALLPPRLLPKLSFRSGIDAGCRTLVVVPSMLNSEETLRELIADLEVRALANADDNLHFALLTDFPDADREEREGEAALIEMARRSIEELNLRHAPEGGDRFCLLHRRRLYNDVERRWMGWERKRGKLEELNRLLRGATNTSFSLVTADAKLLQGVRYVLTLDADTQLPRDVARRLVATIAHPLNRAQLDPRTQRVVRGYGVIQPRVGSSLLSASRSLFARMLSGSAGIDPYTTAVSDVYQDLFAEGVYIGKAIYDVDAFRAALEGRVPVNRLLSHDLFEGLYARAALATDIEILDDQPSAYAVHAAREHRWVRGDWQLASWLLPWVPAAGGGYRRNDLPLIGRWKLFDNLRRSLLPLAMVALLLVGWLVVPAIALLATAAVLATLATPIFGRLATALVRPDPKRFTSSVVALWGDLRAHAIELLMRVSFLPDRARVLTDAILRASFRLLVSGRLLLEWQTASEAERLHGDNRARRRLLPSMLLIGATVLAVALRAREVLPLALPLLFAWAVMPVLADYVSRPLPPRQRPLSPEDRNLYRLLARKTWRFFETFVTADDHHLPPDNYQEDPKGVLAHRTSPTNMGVYLLSAVAARDFGILTLTELATRLDATLGSIEALERHEGHILNWYDTSTLKPLEPRYVSTVDSGNLAAHLVTLRQACRELCEDTVMSVATLQAMLDAVELADQPRSGVDEPAPAPSSAALEARAVLERTLQAPPADLAGWRRAIEELARVSAPLLPHRAAEEPARAEPTAAAPPAPEIIEDHRDFWLAQLAEGAAAAARELDALAPWARLVDAAPAPIASAPSWAALRDHLAARCTLAALARDPQAAALLCEPLQAQAAGDAVAQAFLTELRAAIEAGGVAASALLDRLAGIGARAAELADGMSFGLVYDPDRELFSIGYNVQTARRDNSYYDLLASEARVASLFAIAKGDVSQEHWFRLGRQLTATARRRSLLSWSGSMFEFLMPLLVTRSYPQTLLDETYTTAVARQRQYAAQRRVPWGISESAYNMLDLGLTYQYRAFGVPGLGIKPGLDDELVVAPYATVLAAMVEPRASADNLRALVKDGLDGPFGMYEAIDYTPAHVPPGRHGVVVKCFMAHHQGMSMVALDNVLHGDPMQRRFHEEPRVKASELLLQERVPATVPLVQPRIGESAALLSEVDSGDATEQVTDPSAHAPRAHLLAYGDFSLVITAAGTGYTMWKGLEITRWREDSALDAWGTFCYVRRLDTGAFWSSGLQPTRTKPDAYGATFATDHVEIHRSDGELETRTQVVVSPEHRAEVRRVTVINHGATACEVELTSYAEVVLAARGADLAHPAFGNLFVETELVAERGAVLATRRPRSPGDPRAWVAHVSAVEEGEASAIEHETSRAGFLGRGRSLAAPQVMVQTGPLAGSTGTVLDPILSLRRRATVPPGGRVSVAFTLAVGASREAVLELAAVFEDPRSIARTFELAWTDARVELKHLGISAEQSQRFQRLASALVFHDPTLRAAPELLARSTRGPEGLWHHGISGDLPILLVRIDDPEAGDLLREVLLAHEFWRLNGLSVDVVLLNEEPSGYLRPVEEQTMAVVRGSRSHGYIDQPGGVFLRRSDQMSDPDRLLLQASARVVLLASRGSLTRQLRAAAVKETLPAPLSPARARATAGAEALPPPARELLFDNGLGGFTPDGREYVIDLGPNVVTPLPWCNVIANPRFGFVISESGGGFTWTDNSQTNRLTPWSNDPLVDAPGETIYLRDEEDGAVWSPTPRPAGHGGRYRVRHGQGYSVFEHTRSGIAHELTSFASRDRAIKLQRLRLVNHDKRPRRLSVTNYVEWVLGSTHQRTQLHVVTETHQDGRAILARNPMSAFPGRVAFAATLGAVRGITADRSEFLGRNGSRAHPAAMGRVGLSGRVGAGLDPCAAIQVEVTLRPGESKDVVFLLGEGDSREDALALLAAHATHADVDAALEAVKARWDELLGAVQVQTPDPSMDLLLNRWLLYQAVSCRLWARSAFYQSGGAYGFRDQLQDVLALVHAAPEVAREHIVRAAGRQFREGDVQHWWHPESGQGVRTRYADDLLWLPYVTARYIAATGDAGVLDEPTPFLESRPLADDEHEIFGVPSVSSERASVYEHCVRALDRGTTEGPHGLPLMGGGDWNDGMNRVGALGRGESVWMGWFLAATLAELEPIARARGDEARAIRCRREVARLAAALDEHAWDGEWYRRAYFDDGTPLGSASNSECQIDAIAQSWASIAAVGDPQRARRAMGATDARLVRRKERMVLLFDPPFSRSEPDPGYIQAYPPGLRENGGQYTHGVLWTALAATRLGDGDLATELFGLFNPIHHARDAAGLARYQVEPYVVAADVYSAPAHVGRGGWTWYTGSAAWMYRIGVESILGIERRGDKLLITPCIPASWPEVVVVYRRGRSSYRIVIENPLRVSTGVVRLEVDGKPRPPGAMLLVDDGRDHQVRVVLGTVAEHTRPAAAKETSR